MNPEDLQTLVTMAMPFEKHKVVLLANLPVNYLTWFAREGFPMGEIGRLLALIMVALKLTTTNSGAFPQRLRPWSQ